MKFLLFLSAYRSTVHEAVGLYSIICYLISNFIRFPCNLLFDHPLDEFSSPEEYLPDLLTRFDDIHNFARERTHLTSERMQKGYDINDMDMNSRKGTKSGYRTSFDLKDSPRSYNPTEMMHIQSLQDWKMLLFGLGSLLR